MKPRRHRLAGGDMPRERQQPRLAVLAVLFSQGCAVLARSPTSHDDLCTGTSPTTLQPLGVYIYPIPEAPKSESFYQAGYEQYATELVIPRMLRASKHVVSDPSNASLFLVPNQGMLGFTGHRKSGAPERTNDLYLEDIEWLRRAGPWFDRRGGADHVWIFPSGRVTSIFPDWRAQIGAGLFLTPEGDARTGLVQPHDKDIVIPGYRNTSHITEALLARGPETDSAARPTLIFFRGSTTSGRPGEANYSEGVRQRLKGALDRFVPPAHLNPTRAMPSMPRLAGPEQEFTIFSTDTVPLQQYLREMSLSDFCLVPMGSTSWTLRLYDALFLGCVPVVLSDHIALPFEERIDWSKLVIKWPQADAERLPSFLLSLSQEHIRAKRHAIFAARHHFAWSCPEGGAFAQLVASLGARKQALHSTEWTFDWTGLGQDLAERWLHVTETLLAKQAQKPAVGQGNFWVDTPGDVHALFRKTDGCTGDHAPPQLASTSEDILLGGAQYDVVTVFRGKPNCVLRAALLSLEERLPVPPRKVHLVIDSCDGVEAGVSMHRVRCIELASALPGFPRRALDAIPSERKSWLKQQLAKLAVATQEEVSQTLYVWDGDTIALGDLLPARMPDGRFPLLCSLLDVPITNTRPHICACASSTILVLTGRWGTPLDSPAHFEKKGGDLLLPPGYRASTEALLGVTTVPNVSYVTQWQVWHKPFVREMLREIEERAESANQVWPEAIHDAAVASGHELGFSEYTLYATWLLQRHPSQVQLVSSSEFKWLRDPPSGVLDNEGECCPSDESLCQARLGGFRSVSWECLHASAVRSPAKTAERRRLDLSPGPAPPPSMPPSTCGVSSCTEAVLNTLAPAVFSDTLWGRQPQFRCGTRIAWLVENLNMTEGEACRKVARREYPQECGGCSPGGWPKPAPPPSMPPSTCGVSSCTEAVLNTLAPAVFSDTLWGRQPQFRCGTRIAWLVENLNMTEGEACRKVARREYPQECGGCSPGGWPKP